MRLTPKDSRKPVFELESVCSKIVIFQKYSVQINLKEKSPRRDSSKKELSKLPMENFKVTMIRMFTKLREPKKRDPTRKEEKVPENFYQQGIIKLKNIGISFVGGPLRAVQGDNGELTTELQGERDRGGKWQQNEFRLPINEQLVCSATHSTLTLGLWRPALGLRPAEQLSSPERAEAIGQDVRRKFSQTQLLGSLSAPIAAKTQTVDQCNGSTVTEFILVGFEKSSPSTRALIFVLFLVFYSLAMAMNGLIIFITWTDPRLNSPMYFFLGHLSFLDICFISTTIPQMLIHLVVRNHIVSFMSCMTQMYLVFGVGVTECILLAFMAYDRYVAICHPLNYAQIMNQQVCVRLVSTSWFFGLVNGIFLEYISFRNPFCSDNHIENFFCEAPIVIALSRGDIQFTMKMIFLDAIVVLLSPMALIVISYARILASILGRASSSGARGKTFSTCGSHLTVVIFLYSSAMFSYMNPRSTHGPDKDKPLSLLYTIITPMCNPIIYSFRNKEMKGAMVRALGRTGLTQAESV
nr:unnamed protein product [Sorex araneus]